jgi:tRNA1Val (adenine37-N6)-methyltransferase
MPNDWFQFKQFKIDQDRCAMKVSTDACIQGAWAAAWLAGHTAGRGIELLDIGAGTGLLSLMVAQQNTDSIITAIELNEDAFAQAEINKNASPWKENIITVHSSLQDFSIAENQGKFDFIICNPPFFHNHLQAQEKARNDARHSISLSKEELAKAVSELLADDGVFCVMYPQTEWNDWLQVSCEHGLYEELTLHVKPKATVEPNRVIGLFRKKNNQHPQNETLVIYEEDKSYTPQFIKLLAPYYLAL